ncbi:MULTISPECIES: type I secretion system permease/ATPase [unclassified Mesorhizobium]|uniref:type I secretion system permease/ATPase n=1 Tax=unclassified Mesorhizobium TaxID=325217 RepID=UPI00112CB028|nr:MULTISPECIES: type I secretion system permease/ATPase [unclassified Mesorhizobium]TPK49132.1 type I secretion system permease/ATPase [Mesorhizobium sp. B2-5-2]TPL35128.1 type I secretion system permease/ATPase [Mesorhizobium sp. B2-4-5]TPM71502.1 type I secretion system permease/ATPase [Mesorhizobium sp. B2-1-6]TPN73840.1 type I secretion system permease/ATPase [Mesorhizobium sp. B1-1-2]
MMGQSGLRAVLWRAIADVGVFSLLINVLLLVIPLYLLQVYDRVLPSSNVETLVYLSVIAVLALVFLGFLDAVRSIYTQRVAASIDSKLGTETFAASLAANHASAGLSPLRDLASVCAFIRSRGVAVLFDLPFAPFFLGLLYLIHPVLFWLTLAGVAMLLALVMATQLAIGRNDALFSRRSAVASQSEQAFARDAETLRAMGMVQNAARAWGKHVAEALIVHGRASTANAIFSGTSRAVRMMLQLAILGVGAWLVLQGKMTAGMIFASSLVSSRALQPLDQLIGSWRQIVDARRSWKRLEATLSARPSAVQKLALPDPSGAISAQDLIYVAPNTPGGPPIVKRLNFHIGACEAVAIVGPSGAGKSTLARLLVGALQPVSGSVRIDGADLRTWDEKQLGRHIGYLAQEVELFPGSIAENVGRFDPDADDASIVEAAKRAQAHELILTQRDGYQTMIGLSDRALSGGERQRIGLARALYGNPRILVLDEPNAHLDGAGEAALEAVLSAARAAGTTLIVITHRPSIAAACDRVMLLRDGVIEAFGPSGDLLRQPLAGNSPQQNTVVTGSFATTIRSAPQKTRFGS